MSKLPPAVLEASRSDLDDGLRESLQYEHEIDVRPLPAWKRAVDIIGASLGIVVFSPLMAIVAVLIKIASPEGPVIFVQRRVGLGGGEFSIYKFRTMHTSMEREHQQHVAELAKSNGVLKKPNLNSRLIWLGGFYRDYAIDELPQLFNVLQGRMSLVGPRPDVLALRDYESWQRERFAVLPGATGLWQVSGKNNLTFDEMIWLDISYARNRSPWLDITILGKTVFTVLLKK